MPSTQVLSNALFYAHTHTLKLSLIWVLCLSHTVKRYVRKGVPKEHRALIWMAASGAQDQLEKHPGYYQSLLEEKHDAKLEETIRLGGIQKGWAHNHNQPAPYITHSAWFPRIRLG